MNRRYIKTELELRAARFYESLRRPETEWKSIDDIKPLLFEFEHRFRANDFVNVQQILEKVDGYMDKWGYYSQLVKMREMIVDYINDDLVKESNYGKLGLAYRHLGKIENAVEYYQQALNISRNTGNFRAEGIWLGHIGRIYRNLGRIEDSIKVFSDALEISRQTNDHGLEGEWLGYLGLAQVNSGKIEVGIKYYENALTIARELNDRRNESIWLGRLGSAYHILRRYEDALKFHEQGLAIARELGNRWVLSYRLLAISKTLLFLGDLTRANQLCRENVEIDLYGTNYQGLLILGIILLRLDDNSAADVFAACASSCKNILDDASNMFRARYTLATSMLGQLISSDVMSLEDKQNEFKPIMDEYKKALSNCSAFGVIQEVVQDLDLLNASGVADLKPIYSLFKS